MSDGRGGGLRADAPPSRQAPGPKLQVQRSLSRDTITIHFSAQGKEEDEEEEEEEELYGADAGALEGFRPKETLFFESRTTTGAPGANAASCAVTILPTFGGPRPSSTPPTSSSWPSERPLANPPPTSSGSSSPCKSAGLSSSGPFLSLVRSSSNDAEAREPAPPSHARHRHLMKSFVKSLSADSSKAERQDGSVHQVVHHAPPQQQAQACQRPPPRNMQLLKQFSQPRLYSAPAVAGQVGGDSKTAPSSPTTSPDGRSFFKVQEVEAKIEDTRRRLSEVMSDPLQLFTKLMGEESSAGSAGSGAHRARLLSSSASELSGIPAVNGHSEGYDYSIKEEDGAEGEEDEETPTCGGPDSVFFSFPSLTPAPASAFARSPSLTLGRCSMSALVARQEDDDDFCELYSEDFDLATDTDAPNGDRPGSPGVATGITGLWTELDVEEEEEEEEEGADAVPWMGLVCLTQLLYCYFVLPLPAYVSAVVRGIFAGFALAVVVLWLSGPRKQRRGVEPWNVARLHIKEPDVVKGWMNEIHSYDPELYHATLTHSVYVRLEGSVLRLSKPNRNISRRAAHNEPKPDVTYISQKIYDLSDGKIYLMPHGLARKRVWNKKYPICIELAKQDDFMSNARAGKPQAEAAERAERGDAGLEKDDASAEEQKKPTPGGGDLTIYLFGRTGREKEEWFRRFLLASQMKSNGRGAALPKSAGRPPHTRGHEADSGSGGRGSSDEPRPRDGSSAPSCCSARREMTSDYHLYMAEYVKPPPAPAGPSADGSPGRSPDGSPQTTRKMPETSGNPAEAWLNAFLGRIFWDFLREKYWADIVSKKIQMKLSKIRLPYVMNELTLTELDMGFSVPKILGASQPSVDPQGLWFDAEVSYTGSFLMTLETKMNLTRLGKEGEGLGEHGKEWSRPRTYCLADSDEESSSAGSSDEEDPPEPLGDKAALLSGGESYVGGHRPSKIMRFVDKIAKSKYFQKATETEFIKKKMEEVANTPLVLTVEVQECRGTLAVNVPPPPTDRIWYGFRSPPHLVLKARPKLGEREVTLVHVTDWIEKKLDQEFQKIFVMPNMDDLWLPIMHSAMDTRSNTESNDASKAPETEESEASSYM